MASSTNDETQNGTTYVNHSKSEQENHEEFNSELASARGRFESTEGVAGYTKDISYTEKDIDLYVEGEKYDLDVVECANSSKSSAEKAWSATVTDSAGNSVDVYLCGDQMFVSGWKSADGSELSQEELTSLIRASEQTAVVYTTMTGQDVKRLSFDYYCETTEDEAVEKAVVNQLYEELGMHPYDMPNRFPSSRAGDFFMAGSEFPDLSRFSYDPSKDITMSQEDVYGSGENTTDVGSAGLAGFLAQIDNIKRDSARMDDVRAAVESVARMVESVCGGMSDIGLAELVRAIEAIENDLLRIAKSVGSCSEVLGLIAARYEKAEANIIG